MNVMEYSTVHAVKDMEYSNVHVMKVMEYSTVHVMKDMEYATVDVMKLSHGVFNRSCHESHGGIQPLMQ